MADIVEAWHNGRSDLKRLWRRWARRGGRPILGVALSGGGARGVAHIGVMAALEEAGIHPDVIAGTSAGSIVGSFWAAGWGSDRMLSEVKNLHWREFLRPRLPEPLGLVDGQLIEEMVIRRLGPLRIEDLEIPFTAVAADLLSREPVYFREGLVARALRASSALPGIFTPYQDATGRLLVDGGMVNNLPVEAARALGADLVLAVNVSGAAEKVQQPPQNIFDVLEYSWMMQRGTAAYHGRDPDWHVVPKIPRFGLRDLLERAEEIAESGYQAVRPVLPQIIREWRPLLPVETADPVPPER
ncbi:MAG: patatin-like phospholipase family protein [Chloroflexi bacterium]|nr:patatin-like phospholipase family protein [Chloroflexota bacterium]